MTHACHQVLREALGALHATDGKALGLSCTGRAVEGGLALAYLAGSALLPSVDVGHAWVFPQGEVGAEDELWLLRNRRCAGARASSRPPSLRARGQQLVVRKSRKVRLNTVTIC